MLFTLRRVVFALAALAFAAPALPARAQVPCAAEFGPLREAVERDGTQVKKLVEGKAAREQVCAQMKKFTASEAKYVKFLADNQSWCGIPPEVVKQVKTGHEHTLKLRQQACAAGPPAGAGPRGPPPGPGLSEALGTSRTPAPTDSKNRRGTYDSLTGNPLQR